jgi:hypothetical protein
VINKIAPPDASAAASLKAVFESAVCEVHHAAPPKPQYRMPIVQRRPAPSSVHEEKRALTDAARALARLWNVSPSVR